MALFRMVKKWFCGSGSTKVFARLFQKAADSKGRAFGRTPQRAKDFCSRSAVRGGRKPRKAPLPATRFCFAAQSKTCDPGNVNLYTSRWDVGWWGTLAGGSPVFRRNTVRSRAPRRLLPPPAYFAVRNGGCAFLHFTEAKCEALPRKTKSYSRNCRFASCPRRFFDSLRAMLSHGSFCAREGAKRENARRRASIQIRATPFLNVNIPPHIMRGYIYALYYICLLITLRFRIRPFPPLLRRLPSPARPHRRSLRGRCARAT